MCPFGTLDKRLVLLSVLCEVAAMKSGDHGNSHFAEEIAPVHQLRGFFFPFPVGGGDGATAAPTATW
jgi:hypothetical protein